MRAVTRSQAVGGLLILLALLVVGVFRFASRGDRERESAREIAGEATPPVFAGEPETGPGPVSAAASREPLPIEETGARASGRILLIGPGSAPVAGAQAWLQGPTDWTHIEAWGNELSVPWPDEEGHWLKIRAPGYAEERRFFLPFTGERKVVLTPQASLVGRLVPDDSTLDLTQARVVCWEQPIWNAPLTTARVLAGGDLTGAALLQDERVSPDGRFVVPGLTPGQRYMLYAFHPQAVSRGVVRDAMPGPAEVALPLESIWAATLTFVTEDGRPLRLPTAPIQRTYGHVFEVDAVRDCIQVAPYVEQYLDRCLKGDPLASRKRIGFRWRGAGVPPPVHVKARFPGCPQVEWDVSLFRLADERSRTPVELVLPDCEPIAPLHVSLQLPPLGSGLRDSKVGVLELTSLETGQSLSYALSSRGGPLDWTLAVPQGRYDVHLTDNAHFTLLAGTDGLTREGFELKESGARLTLSPPHAGNLSIELLASEKRAFQEDFTCDLRYWDGDQWLEGSANYVFPGSPFAFRAAIPVLPEGRYVMEVDPVFVELEPQSATPISPVEPFQIDFTISPGQTTKLVLSALE